MATDGDVKLAAVLDTKSAEQSLNNLQKTVQQAFSGKNVDGLDRRVANTNKTLQQTQKEFSRVQAEIAKTEDKLREYETRYNLILERGSRMQSRTNTKEYDGRFYTQRDYDQLTMLDTKLGNIGARLDELNEKSSNLRASLQSMNTNPQAADNVERTASAADEATRSTNGLKNAFSRVTATAATFGVKVLGILGNIGKAVGNTAKTVVTNLGSALTAPIRGIADKITGLFKRISVAMRRVFFLSVLTGAFRNVRSAISNLIRANDSLNSSLRQIKSNLITAFAPIYSAALPAINALANAVARATGYIAAFFSILTGKSIGQSFSQAQNIYSQAQGGGGSSGGGGGGGGGGGSAEADRIDAEIDAIEDKIKAIEKEKKAYEKAKEAEERANKKSLLSFDELNQLSAPEQEDETLAAYDAQIEALEEQLELLQDQKDAIKDMGGAAGGGGGGGGFGGGLEYPTYADEAYDKMAKLVDMLKEAWSNGDFTEIGKKLKDTIVLWLNKIEWNDVKNTAYKLGKSISTFFNGLITPELGGEIGHAIGEALNTAVQFAKGVVDNWDAGNFGKSIAAFINRAIATIDFTELGRTVWTAIDKAFKAAIEFFRDTDWVAIGVAIHDFLAAINWLELLKDIGMFIWEAIIAAVKIAIGLVTGDPMAGAVIDGFNFPAIIAAVNEHLKPIESSFKNLLAGLENTAKSIGSVVEDALSISGQKIHDWVENDGGIINEYFNNLQDTIATVFDFFGKVFSDIGDIIYNWWNGRGGKEVFDDVISMITNVQTTLMEFYNNYVDPIVDEIVELVQSAWDNILKPILEKALDLISAIGDLIATVWNDRLSPFINWLIDTFGPEFRDVIESVGTVFDTAFKLIGSAISTVFDALTGLINFITNIMKGDWDAAWNGMKDTFRNVFNDILSTAENSVNLIINALNSLIRTISNVTSAIGKLTGLDIPNIPSIPQVHLPHLATGAVIPPNREFMAVLGDQKKGTNIEAPLDTIKQAVAEVLGEGGIGGSDNINITFNGDLAGLARLLKPQISRERNRVGSSFVTGGNEYE